MSIPVKAAITGSERYKYSHYLESRDLDLKYLCTANVAFDFTDCTFTRTGL